MNLLNISSGFKIGGLDVKWYGVIMALSYVLALVICIVLCKKKGYGDNLPYKLLLIAFPLAVIGGRLGYVLFYEGDWTFLKILDIRSGGLMLYGGVLLSAVGVLVYAICHKQNVVRYFDLIVPCLVIAQALGRWGNFFNQEAYGLEVTNASWQWFPFAVYIQADGAWHLATFFYESLWCLITFVVTYFVFLKTKRIGMTTCTYFLMYGTERFLVEGLRTDSLYIHIFGTVVRVSQLISMLMVGIAIGYFAYVIITKLYEKHHPWQVDITSPEYDLALKQLEQEYGIVSDEQLAKILNKRQLKRHAKLQNIEQKYKLKLAKNAQKLEQKQLKKQAKQNKGQFEQQTEQNKGQIEQQTTEQVVKEQTTLSKQQLKEQAKQLKQQEKQNKQQLKQQEKQNKQQLKQQTEQIKKQEQMYNKNIDAIQTKQVSEQKAGQTAKTQQQNQTQNTQQATKPVLPAQTRADYIRNYLMAQRQAREQVIEQNNDYDPDFKFKSLEQENENAVNVMRAKKIKEQLKRQAIANRNKINNSKPLE